MKKLISLLLATVLMLNSTAFAVGDANLDSGSGSMGSGSSSSILI